LNFLNLRGRFPLEKYQSTDAKYEQRLNGIRTKPDVASRTSSCDRRSPMNTRPEINMEAFLDARSDTNTFDDLVDDQYTEDLAFEADDSIDEEDDATENIEEDENQSKTSMLPIAGSVLRAGPRAQDDQEILFRELMRDSSSGTSIIPMTQQTLHNKHSQKLPERSARSGAIPSYRPGFMGLP
jgi:hypothetical protein